MMWIIDAIRETSHSTVVCSTFLLRVDEQVTREEGAVGKISYSMVVCSAFVLYVDV